jgi:hypothetical protein
MSTPEKQDETIEHGEKGEEGENEACNSMRGSVSVYVGRRVADEGLTSDLSYPVPVIQQGHRNCRQNDSLAMSDWKWLVRFVEKTKDPTG